MSPRAARPLCTACGKRPADSPLCASCTDKLSKLAHDLAASIVTCQRELTATQDALRKLAQAIAGGDE